MKIDAIPFALTDWSLVERTEHKGESGMARGGCNPEPPAGRAT